MRKLIDQIIQGDCLEIMESIPDSSIDITFADPPFNLKKKYNGYKDNKGDDAYLQWCNKWISEMVRITKPSGSIFVHNIPKWLTYYATSLNEIASFKHWISWDAPSGPMGKSLQPSHYGILYYAKDCKENKFYELRYPHKRCRKCSYLLKDYGGKKDSLHPFGPLVSDSWTDIHRIKHNKYRDEHPCQLPIHLLERLILMSTDKGDIILDPFVGTGTSAISAKRLGRHYIGIDIDEKYVEITKQKLEKETQDSIVGDVWVSFYLGGIATIRDIDWEKLSLYYDKPVQSRDVDFKRIQLQKVSKKEDCPIISRIHRKSETIIAK